MIQQNLSQVKKVNAGGASAATEGKFLPPPKTKVQITGDVTKPGLFGRLKNLFSRGKGTIVGETSKKVTTGAGRGIFSKIFKFGAKGNIISVIIGMLLGQSFDEAIVSLAGFKVATTAAAMNKSIITSTFQVLDHYMEF